MKGNMEEEIDLYDSKYRVPINLQGEQDEYGIDRDMPMPDRMGKTNQCISMGLP
jgi:hypothetical protein